jgi:CheY-like chemotaxis protein
MTEMKSAGEVLPLPGTPTILVVEDEVLVRMAISEYLRQCGFKVIEAGSSAEAITIIQSPVEVDLVFSDIRMAGRVDGIVLANWIRQHRPAIKVVLTSGHADAAKKAEKLCPEQQLVTKPYGAQDVVERIGALLRRTRDMPEPSGELDAAA